jgi:hypothetical protein
MAGNVEGRPAAPATRPVAGAARGGRGARRRDERDANDRFQDLVTAVGLALGLLFVAGGGLLNATVPLPGIDATATAGLPGAAPTHQPTAPLTGTLTPDSFATQTAAAAALVSPTVGATATLQPTATPTKGTATPTPSPTPVPAKLVITPLSLHNSTCLSGQALGTVNLSDPGSQGLSWTVSSSESADITLSDSTGTITGGQVTSQGADPVTVTTGSSAIHSSFTIQFDTMPAAAGPVIVTITCT